jgi:hypothetical protein
LEGKIVSLPKPLAVLQRVKAASPNPRLLDGEGDAEVGDGDGDGDVDMREQSEVRDSGSDNSIPPAATSYAMRTLIRKKIVFSKRPTPIVGLSAKIS